MNPTTLLARAARRVHHRGAWLRRRLRRRAGALGVPQSANDVALSRLRDRHAGESCFIIGNGPSLRMEDLGRMLAWTTFAANRIFLAFADTAFLPTYYSVIDTLVAQRDAAVIRSLRLNKLFPYELRPLLGDDASTIYFETRMALRYGFAPDPLQQDLYGGHTVVFTQLQLAFYMGFHTVYLVGMDHTWCLPERRDGDLLTSGGEHNHFHPDYRRPGERWSVPKVAEQERAFVIARDYYARHGRRILNATRGGRLDVFPRCDLDHILHDGPHAG